jgi:hypothetical protein
VKTAFQLKADFESHQRQKDLEDELFRRTTEMREEIDLNNNMVCIDLGVHSLNYICPHTAISRSNGNESGINFPCVIQND